MDKVLPTVVDENTTSVKLLEKRAHDAPNRTAFIFVDKNLHETVITRQRIWDLSRKFAAVLKRLGLGKSDVVCNTLVNSPERLITYFGTMVSGATPSQGQLFLADGQDLIHSLKETKCNAIIYDPKDLNGAQRILKKLKYTDEVTGSVRYHDLPDLTHVIEIEAKGLEESERWIHIIDKEKDMFVDESISNEDTAMVFVTSGTTGFSKNVPHSHGNLLKGAAGVSDVAKLHVQTVIFNMQSLAWIGGFPAYYTSLGCTRIIVDVCNGAPEAAKMGTFLINVFNRYKVDTAILMAHDIQHVLDAIKEGHELEVMLDALFTGGGPIRSATIEALGKITRKVLNIYAGTEFLLVSINDVKDKSLFKDMCAGRPMKCKLKIVGDDGEELPTGRQGEILMHSGTVFNGYHNNPTKTAEAFTEDGWYKSGDIGYFDKDGLLFVLCRKADVINKDGFKHYPGWIELLINKHPDIQNSALIGIPDPVHHEEICLCMQLMPGAKVSTDDMREYCKKLFLTGQDDKMTPLPKYYFIFDEFILNKNGKIDRNKMRDNIMKRISTDH